MAKKKPTTFTDEHRRCLRNLGVSDAQIDELQSHALPAVALWSSSLPKLQDVRDELSDAFNALKRAQQTISKLRSADDAVPARSEALLRVESAAYEIGPSGILENTLTQLQACQAVVDRATKDLEAQGQRRHRAANPRPIQWVEEALSKGFVKTRHRSRPMPSYVKVSSSPESVFRQIVGICYEASGAANTDPERAIKAYIAQRKKHRADQRQRTVTVVPSDGTTASKKD